MMNVTSVSRNTVSEGPVVLPPATTPIQLPSPSTQLIHYSLPETAQLEKSDPKAKVPEDPERPKTQNQKTSSRIIDLFKDSDLCISEQVSPVTDAKHVIVEYAQWHPFPFAETKFDELTRAKLVLNLTQSSAGAAFTWKKLSAEFGKAMSPVILEGMFVADGVISKDIIESHLALGSALPFAAHSQLDLKNEREQLDKFVANIEKFGIEKKELIKGIAEVMRALEERGSKLTEAKDPITLQGNAEAVRIYGLMKKALETGKDADLETLVIRMEKSFTASAGLLDRNAAIAGAELDLASQVKALAVHKRFVLGEKLGALTGLTAPIAEHEEVVVRQRNDAHVKRAVSFPAPVDGPSVSIIVLGEAHNLSTAVKKWNAENPKDQILLLRASVRKE